MKDIAIENKDGKALLKFINENYSHLPQEEQLQKVHNQIYGEIIDAVNVRLDPLGLLLEYMIMVHEKAMREGHNSIDLDLFMVNHITGTLDQSIRDIKTAIENPKQILSR